MDLTWRTETRRLGDLKKYEQNPRGFTTKQYDEIRQSIDKFGLVEIPAINTDDTLIAGHLRHTVLVAKFGEDHEIEVRVPIRIPQIQSS